MARLALSILGGILGVFIPVISPALGWAIGLAAGGIVGQLVFPGKGPHVYGPRLNDLNVSSSLPGTPIPIIYGSMRIGGQIIWSNGIKEKSTTTKQSAKGAPSVSNTTYTYFVSFAAAFCQRQASVTRIWGDAKLIYDATGTGKLAKNISVVPTFYIGSSTQNQDPTIVSFEGIDKTPAYRGICYAVWEAFPLIDFGNRLPNIRAEVTGNVEVAKKLNTFTPGPFVSGPFTAAAATYAHVAGRDGSTAFAQAYGTIPGYGSGSGSTAMARLDLTINVYGASTPIDFSAVPAWVKGTDSGIVQESALVVDDNNDIWGWIQCSGRAPFTGNLKGGVYIVCIDGTSLQVKRSIGPLIDYVAQGPPVHMAPFTAKGQAYLACMSYYSNWSGGYIFGWVMYVIRCSDAVMTGQYPWIVSDVPKFAGDTNPAHPLIRSVYVPDNNQGVVYICFNGAHDSGNYGETYIVSVNTLGSVTNSFISPGYPVNVDLFNSFSKIVIPVDASIGSIQSIMYDSNDNTFIGFTDKGAICKISHDGSVLAHTATGAIDCITTTGGTYGAGQFSYGYAGGNNGGELLGMGSDFGISNLIKAQFGQVQGGVIATRGIASDPHGEGNNIRIWNANDLSLLAVYDISTWPYVPAGSYVIGTGIYLPTTSSLIFTRATTPFQDVRIYLGRVGTTGNTADAIVADVCTRAGLDPSTVDVSQIAGLSIPGYPISQLQTGKDMIVNLGQTLFFEGRETDFKLQFIPRGMPPILAIPEVDLGLESGNCKLEETITQEQDLPKNVEVLYIASDQDYQQGKQHRIRHKKTKKTINITSISLPMVMTGYQAEQLADKILWTAEAERRSYKTSLWKAYYLLLDPCDVIQFTYDGSVLTGRVTDVTSGQNYATELKIVSEDATNYLSGQAGNTDTGFVPQTLFPTSSTTLWILDIPYLQDLDADTTGATGYYAFMGPNSGGPWGAGTLYYSTDNNTFTNVDTVSSGVSAAVATTILPPPANSVYSWDRVSKITVKMINGAAPPSSDTESNVLNGSNAGILYPSLEVFQFTTVTANGDGTYTLSNLLRGRRGTEWACGAHTAGEVVFFPLETGGVLHEQQPLANIGVVRYYKGVTVGAEVATALSKNFTNTGNDLRPYAPAVVKATRS